MNKIPMTLGGYERLKKELENLKNVERPAVIQAIAEARELGDLSENAEYHAAREKQSFVEGRIAELEDRLARAEIIDISKLSGTSIKFGATITIFDEDTEEKSIYTIVGEDEADIKQRLLSITSPLARALIGKEKGDSINVPAPGGQKSYEVLDVIFNASSSLLSSPLKKVKNG